MFSPSLSQSSSVLFTAAGLLTGLFLLFTSPAQAQTQERAPAQQRAVPPSGSGQAPAGSELPSYAKPSRPSSSFGQRPGGSNTPGGTAQTNDPGTSSPTVPLGGAEWLAAAGAAYALNRLRRSQGEETEADE